MIRYTIDTTDYYRQYNALRCQMAQYQQQLANTTMGVNTANAIPIHWDGYAADANKMGALPTSPQPKTFREELQAEVDKWLVGAT